MPIYQILMSLNADHVELYRMEHQRNQTHTKKNVYINKIHNRIHFESILSETKQKPTPNKQ